MMRPCSGFLVVSPLDASPEVPLTRVQGTVRLSCVVLPDGTVDDVQVVRSLDSSHGLVRKAMLALKQWTFEAGTKGWRPRAGADCGIASRLAGYAQDEHQRGDRRC